MADDAKLTREALEALVDQGNWDELESWWRRDQRAVESIIKDIVENYDVAKAFLVWARLRIGGSRGLREIADNESWRFCMMEHLPFLRDVWMRAPAEAREILIREVFEYDPGEPFRSIRHSHRFEGVGLLPPIGYVPSQKVHALRQLVQAARDKDGLELVDELIEERRTACELAVRAAEQLHEPYRFHADEQELVARLLTLARRAGFRAAVLPEVRVSHQAPPAFVRNPELEDPEAEGVAKRRGRIPRDSNRPVPDEFSIEELLGCYRPRTEDVVLWGRGIDWAARRFGIPKDWLTSVVLIHELGHWLAHKLPAPGALEWPVDSYIATTEELHECWAQLMVWFVAESVGGDFRDAFERLNTRQPAPYRIWERFRTVEANRAFAALVHLRRLREPAELRDWEVVVT